MAESDKGIIPFIKGRRVGPDAIVSRDEQWAARAREQNPPAKEWVYSTFPFYATEAVVLNQSIGTTFNICAMPALGGILKATSARTTVYTGSAGKELRLCLYRYHREKKDGSQRRVLRKILHSEAVIDCATTLRTAPSNVELGGSGAVVHPGEPCFLGFRGSADALRFPTASTDNIGHFAMYYRTHADNESLPAEVNLAQMTKTYQGNIPWVSYLSKEASILF